MLLAHLTVKCFSSQVELLFEDELNKNNKQPEVIILLFPLAILFLFALLLLVHSITDCFFHSVSSVLSTFFRTVDKGKAGGHKAHEVNKS